MEMKRLHETLEGIPERALLTEVVRRLQKNYLLEKGRDFRFGYISLAVHEGTLGRIEYLERYRYLKHNQNVAVVLGGVQ